MAFRIHNEKEPHQFINATMLSYIEGNNKKNKNPCKVLGYWGDLCQGPFSVWGCAGKFLI